MVRPRSDRPPTKVGSDLFGRTARPIFARSHQNWSDPTSDPTVRNGPYGHPLTIATTTTCYYGQPPIIATTTAIIHGHPLTIATTITCRMIRT